MSMTGFREEDHPRAATGMFTDKHHTAPELALGAPAAEMLVITIPAVWWEKDVLPTPRHTKPRDVARDLDIDVTVPATTAEDAPVGFVVRTRKIGPAPDHEMLDVAEEIRVHDGQLYRPLTQNVDGVVSPLPATPQTILDRAFYRYPDERARIGGDTEEQAREAAQQEVDEFLSIDGELWSKTSEPIYYARTYGMGGNHGHTALHVGGIHEFRSDGTAAPEHVFPADQREEAIAYTLALATERGDTRSLESIADPESIDVSGGFVPGSTFTPAPRLTYPAPYIAYHAERFDGDAGALERGLAQLRAQLLTVPGAVIDVPDGWGGMTKHLDPTKLTEQQARDYAEYVEKMAALERG